MNQFFCSCQGCKEELVVEDLRDFEKDADLMMQLLGKFSFLFFRLSTYLLVKLLSCRNVAKNTPKFLNVCGLITCCEC